MQTEEILKTLREQDSFAAMERVVRSSDGPLAAIKAMFDAMHHVYWKEKDLVAAVALGRATVQHGLTAALAADENMAGELRAIAKGAAYDLASFTWTGWDEPGITITSSDLEIGLDAAKTNLRLAIELKKDDLPMSRAYWMLGGQLLAHGKRDEAKANFRRAAEHASRAGAVPDRLLSEGFVILCEDSHDGLDEIRAKLKPLEHGEMFIGQIDTALRVFRRS